MTSEEIIQHLTVWQEPCLAVDNQWTALATSTGAAVDSPLGHAVWRMVDAYTDVVAVLLGVPASGVPEFKHDLSWYAYENDLGRRGHEVSINDESRAIRTPVDLAWVITTNQVQS